MGTVCANCGERFRKVCGRCHEKDMSQLREEMNEMHDKLTTEIARLKDEVEELRKKSKA